MSRQAWGLVVVAAATVCAPRAAHADNLTTLAASTDRPPECSALNSKGSKRANIWRLSRNPSLGAYCDSIAKAHALMESDPQGALAAAQDADKTLPNHASTFAAIGRAELALGHVDKAVDAFESAKKIDERSLDDPKNLNDYAWALVSAKRGPEAAALYRALVPRASLLPDRARSLVFLRAVFALMAHAVDAKTSKDAAAADFADAEAYLTEARLDTTAPLYGDVLIVAALVYDRAGATTKANGAITEARRVNVTPRRDMASYVALAGDGLAVDAMTAEVFDVAMAPVFWQRYLDASPPDAFAAVAKARKGNRKTDPKVEVRVGGH